MLLLPTRGEWEVAFADDPTRALQYFDTHTFDVVVADLRMPGMNGVEFLEQVRERHPEAVRLILSGFADQDMVLRSATCAHQHLAKPCSLEMLRGAVHRALEAGDSIQNEAVKKVVSRMNQLPSVPSLFARMAEVMESPASSLADVADVIRQDPAMTAKVLQLVNSAFFGLRQHIASPSEAVVYLGLEVVRALVLGLQTFAQYKSHRLGGVELEAVWRHSLATASLASRIGRDMGQTKAVVDGAFTAGLLHDVGKVVLACNEPDAYEQACLWAQARQTTLAEAERASFGCEHGEIGAYMLTLWGLPWAVVDGIGYHHATARAVGEGFFPLAAVHVANVIVQQNGMVVGGAAPASLDAGLLQRFGLSERLALWTEAAKSAPPPGTL